MKFAYESWKEDVQFVVLGASGNLAERKTLPALFALYNYGLLPKNTQIVGYARTKMTTEEFRKRIGAGLKSGDNNKTESFLDTLSYISGQYDDEASFQNLNSYLGDIYRGEGEPKRLFYMALPPSQFDPVSKHLRKVCYPKSGNARIVIEKPFGHDLDSYRELSKALTNNNWQESELYRIDHYLGKEMVKNLQVFRFANSFLTPSWNKEYIDNVQITFKEPIGTGGRQYFDENGIIRDVMQNHLLQILLILAMEKPIKFTAEEIRNEKMRVLTHMQRLKIEDVLIGQYGPSPDGQHKGYLEENDKSVNPRCATYAVCVLYVDNERWRNVPFILRAGKGLNESKVEVRIQYRDMHMDSIGTQPRNEIVFRVQPDEAIYIKMNAKQPGLGMNPVTSNLDFTYKERFNNLYIPEAYESLILDALQGDHTNFVRSDELEKSWDIFTPVLHILDSDTKSKPYVYPFGSRGPKEADEFIAKRGYRYDHSKPTWPRQNL